MSIPKDTIQLMIENCLGQMAVETQSLAAAFPQVFPSAPQKNPNERTMNSNWKPQIPALLAPDVEYRLREVIQDSVKFMKHSKRNKLTTEDVNKALRVRNLDPLYGFSASKEPLQFRKVVPSGLPTNKELYIIDDKEYDLNHILNAPLPQTPREPSLAVHWLAIEGTQPLIPQNVTPDFKNSNFPSAPPQIRKLVKHVLSRELQIYYEQFTKVLKTASDNEYQQALQVLSQDNGVSALLPYFIQFIFDETFLNLKDFKIMFRLVQMAKALLDSPTLSLEPYVHQLMPILVTSLMGEFFSDQPNHFALRKLAGTILSQLISAFGKLYYTLQPRLCVNLLEVLLDPSRPLAAHYGALLGFSALEASYIARGLMANLDFVENLLSTKEKTGAKAEVEQCYEALLLAAHKYVGSEDFRQTGLEYYCKLYELFGEKLQACMRPSEPAGFLLL